MTRTPARLMYLLAVVLIVNGLGAGQVQTGTPPFGSFGGGPFDTVNLGNLNVHFAISVVNKAGRGMAFPYNLSYDNSVWYPVGASGSQNWQPVQNWGWRGQTEIAVGYVTYTSSQTKCFDGSGGWYWGQRIGNYVYHDPWGIPHGFPISLTCGDGTSEGVATDGSGYYAFFSNKITAPGGQTFTVPTNSSTGAGTATDANGNQISVSAAGVFTDTLGTTALTVSGQGTPTSPLNFAYTSPAGTSASYVMHYTNKTVKTAFACLGIAEYGPTTIALVSDITLPDGSQYTFQYEPTPGDATKITGRLKQVTLPTGGTITYTYTGGSNGITCADGSASGLTRALSPGGSWTYARSGSGNSWTTTVTDPQTPGNQTVISFQKDSAISNPTNNFYETQRLEKQGSTTLLRTTIACYNGNGVATPSSCPTTVVSSPITRRTVFGYLPDASGKQAETDTFYNAYGLVTEVDEYDFGNAAVGALTRKTLTSYAALGNGIVDHPSSVTIKDGSNNVIAQTNYTYDEGSATSTTGTPQHATIAGSHGNLTTLAAQVNATQTLYRKFTYYDTGTLNTSTDVSLSSTTNGAATTYVYGSGTSCGNSFPTQVNLPLSLARSMAWNCTGGVQVSLTDENNNQITVAYTDPHFWRPASATDQLNNTVSMTYVSTTTREGAFAFNVNASILDGRSTVDSLGRPKISQRKQGPSATNYDSVENDYDVAGRLSKTTEAYAAAAGSLCSGTCPGTTYLQPPE